MCSLPTAPTERWLAGSPAATRWYISEAGSVNLPKYRYVGSDNSLVYKYFCSPLAEVLVRAVPAWLAPNAITCLGLVPSSLGHAVLWHHCGDLRARCPAWCWALSSVCTFVYQTLDNMDGKQARRTGSSSPLGLLLDHSADALNIILSTLNIMAMFQVGGLRWHCLAIWLGSTTPFFFATWEEYYTGELYLGIVNGPTEGVLIVCATAMVSALAEDYTSFWNGEVVFGISRKVAMITFIAVSVVVTLTTNIAGVAQESTRETTRETTQATKREIIRETVQETRRQPLPEALRRPRPNKAVSSLPAWCGAVAAAAPFCVSSGAAAGLLALPSAAAALARRPRLLLWLQGLPFLHSVTRLQLAHICAEAYEPLRLPALAPYLVAAAGFCCVALEEGGAGGALLPAAPYACVALLAASWLHLVCCSSREMADVLGIHVFSIAPRAEPSGDKRQ